MKFVLIAEGQTEKRAVGSFLQRWLDEKLKPRHVGVHVINLAGSGNFVKEFAKRAEFHLSGGEDGQTIAVIGLLDFYGCPPATDLAALEKQVGNDKFRMFFAVHESEAWLLSEPNILPRAVRDALPSKMSDKPEAVNANKPPSKLLDELFIRCLNRAYKKSTHGQQFFAKLDPGVACEKCPKLREMLDTMLAMAKSAGL